MHIHKNNFRLGLVWLLAVLLFAASARMAQAASRSQSAQEGKAVYERLCKSCHTIGGGRLVGPDLQDITQRRELAWLSSFIAAPDKVIAAGDPIALQLLNEYNGVEMPNLGVSQAEVDALLAFLENPDGGGAISPGEPLQPGDAIIGEGLFSGAIPLKNGGINCIACHHVVGSDALGGGTLGPDLTQVLSRYGGQAALAGALDGLPFPTMQGIFASKPLTRDEQEDLLAYFQKTDQGAAAAANADAAGCFWIAGGLGALAFFGVMLIFWSPQRKSISARLREKA